MASPIADILRAFAKEYTGDVKKLEALVVQYLADGLSPKDAVDTAIAKLGFFGKVHEAIQTTMVLSCAAGNGGTIPLIESLASPWDGSGMTLSQKLHGADMNMRKAIIGTIKEQLKLGTHARSVALELYDGYNSGKHVVRHQELPKYLKGILSLAQKGELSKQEKLHLNVLIDQAREQVAQLGANGAPNQALKAAYSQLLDAVEKGAEKALANGIKVAAEEKSRYVAERIARTEAARAWAQGFVERYGDDDEVSCYQWKLSSRHPFTDICDMYASANLWGLGKGIFPKDKCPALPAHPHCLCHLAPVYAVEVDASDSHDRVKQGGDEWLASLSYGQRCTVLGVSGAKAWEQGHSDWRQYMRGWTGAVLKGIHGGNNVANGENSGIIISGGIMQKGGIAGALDPSSERAQEHAERYYGLVRAMTTDCERIAKNTGFAEADIRRIKNHVFIEEHELSDGEKERFAPSYHMAQSWQRLIDGGKIEQRDIILLNHELMESKLMSEGMSYREAHKKAEAVYNYSETVNEGR